MIPRAHIDAWRKNAPWQANEHVEQDLIICRSLVEIFSDKELNENLAFRGGTALHKLHSNLQSRYSEDIDLVQINAEPIGNIINRLRERMSFLGKPNINQKTFIPKVIKFAKITRGGEEIFLFRVLRKQECPIFDA